jgi:acyl-CoA thioester hydrolase
MQNRYCFKIAYADTDQMGVMYHGTYFRYFENARHDMLAGYGIDYADLEQSGIIMPVISATIEYYKPVFFGQTIEIETVVRSVKGVRIVFEGVMKNGNGEMVCESTVTLAFVNKETLKPCPPPAIFTRI